MGPSVTLTPRASGCLDWRAGLGRWLYGDGGDATEVSVSPTLPPPCPCVRLAQHRFAFGSRSTKSALGAGFLTNFFLHPARGAGGKGRAKADGRRRTRMRARSRGFHLVRLVGRERLAIHGNGNVRAGRPTRRGVGDHVAACAVVLTGRPCRPVRSGVWSGRRTCSCRLDGWRRTDRLWFHCFFFSSVFDFCRSRRR